MLTIITHFYPPVVNPPAHRMNHLVRTLVQRDGADGVRVLTGRPNHPDGVLPREFRWRLFARRRGPHGERVLHLYELATPNAGFIRKTLGYVSFAASLFLHLLFTRIRPGDLFFVTTPPVFTAYAVYFASRLRPRLRYILDVRDLWPEAIAGIGFIHENSRTYNLFCRLSERVYRGAYRLCGNSRGIVDHLARTTDQSPETIALVHNPVDTDVIGPLTPEQRRDFRHDHADLFGDASQTVFLFSGVHAVYIDLLTLVRALEQVHRETPAFRALLIGYGEQKDELARYVAEHGLGDQVKLLDFMPKAELMNYIGAADVCYVSLKDTPTLRYAIPSKTLEYLACGRPVLAALAGPFAEMLRQAGVATVVAPGDVQTLARTISACIASPPDPSPEGREFVEQHFSVARFDEGMQRLLPPPSRS